MHGSFRVLKPNLTIIIKTKMVNEQLTDYTIHVCSKYKSTRNSSFRYFAPTPRPTPTLFNEILQLRRSGQERLVPTPKFLHMPIYPFPVKSNFHGSGYRPKLGFCKFILLSVLLIRHFYFSVFRTFDILVFRHFDLSVLWSFGLLTIRYFCLSAF